MRKVKCRLCLRKRVSPKLNIISSDKKYADLTLIDFLYWIFGVEVDVNDPYSKYICRPCEQFIQYVATRRALYQKNQLILDRISKRKSGGDILKHQVFEDDIQQPNNSDNEKSHPIAAKKRRRLDFINYYYNAPTIALRNLITKKSHDKTDNNPFEEDMPVRNAGLLVQADEASNMSGDHQFKDVGNYVSPVQVAETVIGKPHHKTDNNSFEENMPVRNAGLLVQADEASNMSGDHQFEDKGNYVSSVQVDETAIEKPHHKTDSSFEEDVLVRNERTLVQVNETVEVMVCKYCSKVFKTERYLSLHCKSKHRSVVTANRELKKGERRWKRMNKREKSLYERVVSTETGKNKTALFDSKDFPNLNYAKQMEDTRVRSDTENVQIGDEGNNYVAAKVNDQYLATSEMHKDYQAEEERIRDRYRSLNLKQFYISVKKCDIPPSFYENERPEQMEIENFTRKTDNAYITTLQKKRNQISSALLKIQKIKLSRQTLNSDAKNQNLSKTNRHYNENEKFDAIDETRHKEAVQRIREILQTKTESEEVSQIMNINKTNNFTETQETKSKFSSYSSVLLKIKEINSRIQKIGKFSSRNTELEKKWKMQKTSEEEIEKSKETSNSEEKKETKTVKKDVMNKDFDNTSFYNLDVEFSEEENDFQEVNDTIEDLLKSKHLCEQDNSYSVNSSNSNIKTIIDPFVGNEGVKERYSHLNLKDFCIEIRRCAIPSEFYQNQDSQVKKNIEKEATTAQTNNESLNTENTIEWKHNTSLTFFKVQQIRTSERLKELDKFTELLARDENTAAGIDSTYLTKGECSDNDHVDVKEIDNGTDDDNFEMVLNDLEFEITEKPPRAKTRIVVGEKQSITNTDDYNSIQAQYRHLNLKDIYISIQKCDENAGGKIAQKEQTSNLGTDNDEITDIQKFKIYKSSMLDTLKHINTLKNALGNLELESLGQGFTFNANNAPSEVIVIEDSENQNQQFQVSYSESENSKMKKTVKSNKNKHNVPKLAEKCCNLREYITPTLNFSNETSNQKKKGSLMSTLLKVNSIRERCMSKNIVLDNVSQECTMNNQTQSIRSFVEVNDTSSDEMLEHLRKNSRLPKSLNIRDIIVRIPRIDPMLIRTKNNVLPVLEEVNKENISTTPDSELSSETVLTKCRSKTVLDSMPQLESEIARNRIETVKDNDVPPQLEPQVERSGIEIMEPLLVEFLQRRKRPRNEKEPVQSEDDMKRKNNKESSLNKDQWKWRNRSKKSKKTKSHKSNFQSSDVEILSKLFSAMRFTEELSGNCNQVITEVLDDRLTSDDTSIDLEKTEEKGNENRTKSAVDSEEIVGKANTQLNVADQKLERDTVISSQGDIENNTEIVGDSKKNSDLNLQNSTIDSQRAAETKEIVGEKDKPSNQADVELEKHRIINLHSDIENKNEDLEEHQKDSSLQDSIINRKRNKQMHESCLFTRNCGKEKQSLNEADLELEKDRVIDRYDDIENNSDVLKDYQNSSL